MDITCSTDISSCCSDYGIASYLYIIKKALTIIQIAVPIILILMGSVQLIKMMTNPDDNKGKKIFLNKFIAAVIVFLLPIAVNIVMGLMPEQMDIAGCWESAENIVNNTINGTTKYKVSHTDNSKKEQEDTKNYEIISTKEKAKKTGKAIDTSSSGGLKIANYALKFVGNPYVYGGSSLTSGCDCSHFVYLVLKKLGVYEGGYVVSSQWITKGKEVKGGLSNAQAGDVVVYDGHVGIYDGKKYLIEAKSSSTGITHNRRPQDSTKKLLGVRRFV